MTRLNFFVSGWTVSLDDKTLAWVNLACVAGAKRGGRKARKPEKGKGGPFIPLPFSLSPYPLPPFDACYAGLE